MKTAEERLACIQSAAAARKARFLERQVAAGISPLHVAVPNSWRDIFRRLATKAREGASPDLAAMVLDNTPLPDQAPIAAAPVPEAAPEIPTPPEATTVPAAAPEADAEALQFIDAGKRIGALLKRHPELNQVLLRATATQSGEFVAMLAALFDAQLTAILCPPFVATFDTPVVPDPVAEPVAVPDTPERQRLTAPTIPDAAPRVVPRFSVSR